MMFFGFAEVLVLAVMTGGTASTDLVDLIHPTHYFAARDMEPSVDKMADMAGEEPKNAKASVLQLTSLRYLADEAVALKKSSRYAEHRKSLEAIAQGKKAQDPMGFAKEYAQRVLHKLDNTKPALVKLRPVREDSLSWFPANATLVGALDFQHARQSGVAKDPIRALLKMMPEREKKEMYSYIEKSGNIRLERASFAWVEGTGKGDGKIFMRFTGKGNQDWLVGAFNALEGGRGRMQIKVMNDKEPRITLIQDPNSPAAIMLVGNTDIMIFGNERNGPNGDLVAEVTEIRAKKKPNADAGPLKDRLAKIPDKAVAMLVGEIPLELKREFGGALDPWPTKITAFIERGQQGMDIQVESTQANEQDGGKLVRKVGELRKQGIKGLQDAMQQPLPQGSPPIPFQELINLMDTIQVQGKDGKVQVRAFVPDALVQRMISTYMEFNARQFEAK